MPKLSEQIMAHCADCQESILWKENYIVRPEVWTQAGMGPKAGYLHLACLESRLKRALTEADFLVVYSGENKKGIQMTVVDAEAYQKFNAQMGY